MPSYRLTTENANFLLNCSEIELNLKATRRSFVLLLFFDLTFTSLLWLIYCTTKGLSLEDAFDQEIKNYNIDSSLFDVAAAALVRFFFLNLFYTIFKLNHWLPAAIITFSSSSFLISKVIIFAIKATHKVLTDYLILIISFLIVWAETGYLDMKIFSIVRKKNALLDTDSTISNTSRANYGSVNTPRGILSEVTSFYASPLDSPRDFLDDDYDSVSINSFRKEKRHLKRKNSKNIKSSLNDINEESNKRNDKYQEYEKLSEQLLETLIKIKNDDKDWTVNEFYLIDLLNEKSVKSDFVDPGIKCSIKTKSFPKIGKVFKLDTIIPFKESLVLKVLRDEVEECSDWNVTVKKAKIIAEIRENLSILHVCVHEQAGGLVSQRDFVNLNCYCFNDKNEHILANLACKSDDVPVNESYVRGENGPTGYIFSGIDNYLTKFTWILNVNLKGWLPQYLIDQSLNIAQKEFIVTLLKHLNQKETSKK